MATKKAKPARVGKPKKKVVAKTPPKHPYKVRYGTRNELGEIHQYQTQAAAKQAIIAELDGWVAWCKRYNNAGLDAITTAKNSIGSIVFHEMPGRIECVFDEHTGMHIIAEYWMNL